MDNKKLPRFEEDSEKINDDSGYDMDSSGVIPKLEELKAQGDTKILSRLDELDEEDDDIPDTEFDESKSFIFDEEDRGVNLDNDIGYEDSDISDDYLFGRDFSDEDFIEEKTGEDLTDADLTSDDVKDQYSGVGDKYIEDFDEMDDLSNLKVNFYDEYVDDRSEIARNLERIAIALEKIAEKL